MRTLSIIEVEGTKPSLRTHNFYDTKSDDIIKKYLLYYDVSEDNENEIEV